MVFPETALLPEHTQGLHNCSFIILYIEGRRYSGTTQHHPVIKVCVNLNIDVGVHYSI